MFKKTGEGKILNVVDEEELNEKQKKAVKTATTTTKEKAEK